MVNRQLHGTGDDIEEPESMVLLYILSLAISAGMTSGTCVTAFKWRDVRTDPGRGTMFMVFLWMCLWSICSLLRIITVYLNDREDDLSNKLILYVSAPTEITFNAISIWLSFFGYEIYRKQKTPRGKLANITTMNLYMIWLFGIVVGIMVSLIILDNIGVSLRKSEYEENEGFMALVLENISWGTWLLRILSVMFTSSITLISSLAQQSTLSSQPPRAVHWFIGFFFLMNMPYLIIEPFYDFGVFDIKAYPILPSILKCITYSTGIVISLIMGQYVADFDAYFSPPTLSDHSQQILLECVSDDLCISLAIIKITTLIGRLLSNQILVLYANSCVLECANC